MGEQVECTANPTEVASDSVADTSAHLIRLVPSSPVGHQHNARYARNNPVVFRSRVLLRGEDPSRYAVGPKRED